MSKKKLIEQTHKLLSETYRPIWVGQFPYCVYMDTHIEDTSSKLSKSAFIAEAKTLVGDNKLTQVISDWFDEETGKLAKKILAYLDKFTDGGSGSQELSNEMLIAFADEESISDETIVIFLESFYKEKFLAKYMDSLLDGLNPETADVEVLNSHKKRIQRDQTEKIAELCIDEINAWYSKSVVEDRLLDLFSQFVLTLGKTEWKVTWVGHGPMTEEKLLKCFEKDSDFHHGYILKRYSEWFEEAVNDASEREMNNAYHTRLWDKIQKGELKLNTDSIDDLDI